MWYNRFVKRFISAVVCAALTASVLCAAPGIKTKYADAQQGDVTAYPDFVSDLDTGDIDCYAANGNRFAFCRGEYIYIYSGGSMSDAPQDDGSGGTAYIFEGGIMENSSESGIYAYKHTSVITNIGYGEDCLLFTDATGTNYSYIDGEAKKEQEKKEEPAKKAKKSFTTPAKERSRYERAIAKAEEKIALLEEKIGGVKQELSWEENVSDYMKLSELQAEIDSLETELDTAMSEWEKLSDEYSELIGQQKN